VKFVGNVMVAGLVAFANPPTITFSVRAAAANVSVGVVPEVWLLAPAVCRTAADPTFVIPATVHTPTTVPVPASPVQVTVTVQDVDVAIRLLRTNRRSVDADDPNNSERIEA
jgi:hypothetical protein